MDDPWTNVRAAWVEMQRLLAGGLFTILLVTVVMMLIPKRK